MKAKTYELLERCVELGVTRGIARAFKHDERPDRDAVEASCVREVMNEVQEWFEFGEQGGDRGEGRLSRGGWSKAPADL